MRTGKLTTVLCMRTTQAVFLAAMLTLLLLKPDEVQPYYTPN